MRGFITDPSAPGGLRLADDLPEPVPGDDTVVIEVHAVGVNRGELRLLQLRPEGWRPGQDLAGVVVRGASDGSGPAEGTRVVAIAEMGGWSDRIALPSNVVAPLPDGVGFDEAASLPIAGLTALRALRAGGDLLGRRVLVTGATGGVGQFAVQLARAGGAEVTAHVSDTSRGGLATELGARRVVTDLEDESCGPFHLVLDGVGGAVLKQAIRRLVPAGTALTYGTLGGDAALSLADFRAAPHARLVGFFHAQPQETRGEDLGILAALVGDGRLRPHLGSVRDFREAHATLEALRRREIRGKAVLTLD